MSFSRWRVGSVKKQRAIIQYIEAQAVRQNEHNQIEWSVKFCQVTHSSHLSIHQVISLAKRIIINDLN